MNPLGIPTLIDIEDLEFALAAAGAAMDDILEVLQAYPATEYD